MKGKNRTQKVYIPRTTTKPIRKKKRKKENLRDFKSKGQSKEVNLALINMEKAKCKQKNIVCGIMAFVGFLLLITGVKDDLMFFEGFGFKFTGTLVGTLVLIFAGIGFATNNVKAEVEN